MYIDILLQTRLNVALSKINYKYYYNIDDSGV